MAKKFDTNPLDPDFPEKVKEKETSSLFGTNGQTRQFAEPSVTEEQTRKFNDMDLGEFNSVHGPESGHPAPYHPPGEVYHPEEDRKRSLKIGSISLPENILTALPYIPFGYIGLIAGIIELIFIPKTEPKVRYHAAQGIAAQIAMGIVLAILGIASWGSDLAETAAFIFSVVTTIVLIVFAIKAWQGKPIHIETVESLTDWLEDKIKPQS